MKNLVVKEQKIIAWENTPAHKVDHVNWKVYDYSPIVSFKLAHRNNTLYLKFEVEETQMVRTQELSDQSPIYEDSCVEFFLLHTNGNYLNIEANSQGYILAAIGKNKTERKALNTRELKKIERTPSGVKRRAGKYYWSLTLGIPFDVLGVTISKSYRANFYKCGNKTENTHYLSWSPIHTNTPDFHQPDFFGKITFE